MKKNRLSKINKILEMPSEIISSVPKITNLGFKKMMIENYKNILEYQDFFIRINTSIGIININGIGMKMEEMTKDDVIIEGEIDSIDFEKIED
ncbi:MAG: YabP/YqfC family sporulation protein [Clostridia bacterium]|nr:YabP/YqfC family sporulation protein [Clostridia bacterium]